MTRNLRELDQALTDKTEKHESDVEKLYRQQDTDRSTIWKFMYALAGYVIAYSVGLAGWLLNQRSQTGKDIAETAQQQLQQTVGMYREGQQRIDKIAEELAEHERSDVLVRERQNRVIERLDRIEKKGKL